MISDEGAATPKSELKENVAADETLRDSSMSHAALSALSFEGNTTVPVTATPTTLKISDPPAFHEPIPISSASSTCTRESDAGAYSDAECVALNGTSSSSMGSISPSVQRLYRDVSEQLNAKVCNRKTSRQGRAGQRTLTENNESIRLVTGAVPILRGGLIMFVSSRKKAEWIIPKGGWEKDETIEESAIREVFEEAGVLGVLGPRLGDIQYETRKAKKRRLDLESLERDMLKAEAEAKTKAEQSSDDEKTTEESDALLSAQDIARIRAHAAATREKQPQQQDDKSSVGSTSHSRVRMMIFPLYVQQVYDEWPESGRFRKAVDIDTAIQMLENRPELKQALLEVKERGLHLSETSDLEAK